MKNFIFCAVILLDEIVDKHNKAYHRTIKMKPVDVQLVHILIKIINLKVGDYVRISKSKSIFAKGYTTRK